MGVVLDKKRHLQVSPDLGLGQSITKETAEKERERGRQEEEEEEEGLTVDSNHSISIFSIPQSIMNSMMNEEERERLEPKITLKETGHAHKMEERKVKTDKRQLEEEEAKNDDNPTLQSESITKLPPLKDNTNVTIPTETESTSTQYGRPVVTPTSPPLYSSHPSFFRRSSSNYDSGIVLNPPSDGTGEESGDRVGGVDDKVVVADAYTVIEREESGRRHEVMSQIKEEKIY